MADTEPAEASLRAPAPAWMGMAAGALLVLAPLATWIGVDRLARRAQEDVARLEQRAAPIEAAAAARAQARALLLASLKRPTLGSTLEALAKALPTDSSLARVERTEDGRLVLDISTPDPDRLRTALRRASGLERLRDTGQRRAEAAMLVTFEERGE